MKKRILFAIFLILIIIAGFFAWKIFGPGVANPQSKYFYIHTGDDLATVKENLILEKMISGNQFDLVSKILKYKNPKPGRYTVKDGTSLFKLVRLLRSGNQSLVKVVIIKERTPEGLASKFGMGKKFDCECDSADIAGFLTDNEALKAFSADTNTAMAQVMPYTYEIKWNSTAKEVFQHFNTAFKKFWNDERKAKADSLQLTPYKVITLASIVEEETNDKSDKLNVASTYLNRVRTGMKLQADPTVKFAMKNFGLKRVTGAHLKTDSKYNTYMYAGIPPGPICTPSINSIEAVLNAPQTDYLYFVASSKFDGSSVFTTNYSDHLKYAREYQRELTRRMDSARKARTP